MRNPQRALARAMALMLIAAMLLIALASCKKQTDAELIVGKWSAALDMSKYMKKQAESEKVDDEFMKKIMENFNFDNLSFNLIFEFEKDGKYKSEVDEQSFNDMIKALGSKFAEAAKATDTDGTYLAQFSAVGLTWDDIGNKFIENANFHETSFSNLDSEGTYKLEDGKLKLIDENGELDSAIDYSLSRNELKFNSVEFIDTHGDEAEALRNMLPFAFKKN